MKLLHSSHYVFCYPNKGRLEENVRKPNCYILFYAADFSGDEGHNILIILKAIIYYRDFFFWVLKIFLFIGAELLLAQ